ncbi:MAG TPA: hypothetical protein DCL43_01585 [Chitinophagaceae bacterium]|nr:hypothetical protein [Chitinophagaceae bacterium]
MTKLQRILVTSAPIAFVIRKSKRIVLPGFEAVPLYDVVIFFFQQINKVGLNERAAAVSFNFVMAIPAATLFLLTLIPYLPFDNLYNELLRFVGDLTPNKQTKQVIVNFLEDFFHKPKTGLLSIGFALVVFYSSNAMMGIIRTFDKSITIDKNKTNFIEKRWRAIRMTTVLIFVVIATLLISMGQGYIFKNIMRLLGIQSSTTQTVIHYTQWLVVVLLLVYSIGYIYKYGPTVTKRWKLASPGAIFATLLISFATLVFAYWAQNISTYSKVYGSIGSILIIMTLIFIIALIILIGFELNVSISVLKATAAARERAENLAVNEQAQLSQNG